MRNLLMPLAYDDVDAYFAARIQAWNEEHRAKGRETGRAEGRVMGQRESMRRQAAMKFDAETAARLGVVLEGVADQEVFDGVLTALPERDTPSDLLARATGTRRRTSGGSGSIVGIMMSLSRGVPVP